MGYTLWNVQGLLALLFLFSGGMKLAQPLGLLRERLALPGPFVRFLGLAEVLGAAGLVLPALLNALPFLTPVSAAGLVTIMIGATTITWARAGPARALLLLVTELLLMFVAWGRLVQ